MKCWRCQHDRPPDAASCPHCGALPAAVDLERVRAQLKRWQEKLLDLSKANPLLGVNRSRVSKLRISEPSANALFRDFVVAEDTKLKIPHVVKTPREPVSEPELEHRPELEYRIEPGDLSFDARALDLMRRLRRIYDNARTTVEERGVTTLHLSFGVLKWEDPLLGESVSPLWLVPCELLSFGPNAPMYMEKADEEMQLNPALELYLRERHRLQLPSMADEPTDTALAQFLEEVQALVRDHGWKAEAEVWLSTYTFESLAIYQDLKALADTAITNHVVVSLARATAPPEGSESLGEEALDALVTPEQVPVPVLPADSSQLKALTWIIHER
jgi:hypothetical protein